VEPLRDQIWIDKNTRADNAAHHGHGRAEQAELTRERLARARFVRRVARSGSGDARRL
jgi:hypothetical protein